MFIGKSGDLASRLSAEYEMLFTQCLILTPEIEMNFYAQDDIALGIGSGLSDAQFGLRLRYEIHREFAPYIGMNWARKYSGTADNSRAAGEDISDAFFVAGARLWF